MMSLHNMLAAGRHLIPFLRNCIVILLVAGLGSLTMGTSYLSSSPYAQVGISSVSASSLNGHAVYKPHAQKPLEQAVLEEREALGENKTKVGYSLSDLVHFPAYRPVARSSQFNGGNTSASPPLYCVFEVYRI